MRPLTIKVTHNGQEVGEFQVEINEGHLRIARELLQEANPQKVAWFIAGLEGAIQRLEDIAIETNGQSDHNE